MTLITSVALGLKHKQMFLLVYRISTYASLLGLPHMCLIWSMMAEKVFTVVAVVVVVLGSCKQPLACK